MIGGWVLAEKIEFLDMPLRDSKNPSFLLCTGQKYKNNVIPRRLCSA